MRGYRGNQNTYMHAKAKTPSASVPEKLGKRHVLLTTGALKIKRRRCEFESSAEIKKKFTAQSFGTED